MRSAERREVTRLLSTLYLRPVTLAIAQAGVFMRSYRAAHTGIGLGDYLVAATGEVLGLEPATLNVRPFPMFDELEPPLPGSRQLARARRSRALPFVPLSSGAGVRRRSHRCGEPGLRAWLDLHTLQR